MTPVDRRSQALFEGEHEVHTRVLLEAVADWKVDHHRESEGFEMFGWTDT